MSNAKSTFGQVPAIDPTTEDCHILVSMSFICAVELFFFLILTGAFHVLTPEMSAIGIADHVLTLASFFTTADNHGVVW